MSLQETGERQSFLKVSVCPALRTLPLDSTGHVSVTAVWAAVLFRPPHDLSFHWERFRSGASRPSDVVDLHRLFISSFLLGLCVFTVVK